VSVALAEFQFFLFISIISGAAGRRRPTLMRRKAEKLKVERSACARTAGDWGQWGKLGTEKERAALGTGKENFIGVGVGIGIGIDQTNWKSTPIPIPTPTPMTQSPHTGMGGRMGTGKEF